MAVNYPDEPSQKEAEQVAGSIERAGGRVVVVDGEQENLKVTTRPDLELAELLLGRRAARRAERGAAPAA